MNELIKISDYNGKKAVSARELYTFLGYDETQFSRFFDSKIRLNEFAVEGIDYQYLDIYVEMPNGGHRVIKDCSLTLDFAKKLAMISKTKKGEEARDYFIAMEKVALSVSLPDFNNPAIAARAWADQYEKREIAEKQVKELEPKAEIYEHISNSDNLLSMNEVAKAMNLGYGRNILFKKLRDKNILMSNNVPYQKYIDAEYFEVKIKPIEFGEYKVDKPTTYVTGKGLTWLSKLLNQ